MSIKIHGKEYTMVAERLAIMKDETESKYSLETEMLRMESGTVLCKATLFIEGRGTYTGHSFEEMGNGAINKTSFVEVAETSAIGRALASAGYHGSEFASAEEVVEAINKQNSDKSPKTAPNKQDNTQSDSNDLFPVKKGPNAGKTWDVVDTKSVIWAYENLDRFQLRATGEINRRWKLREKDGQKNLEHWVNRHKEFFYKHKDYLVDVDSELIDRIYNLGLSSNQDPADNQEIPF